MDGGVAAVGRCRRVLTIADESTICAEIELLLRSVGDVVEFAANGEFMARFNAAEEEPSVILVDLDHRVCDGVSVIRAIHEKRPYTPVLCVIGCLAERRILAALIGGASGCLLSGDLREHLLSAVDEAMSGGVPLSRPISKFLLHHIRQGGGASSSQSSMISPMLSIREREILNELARGLTYDQIATAQGISVNTVRGFVRAIYGKLEVGSKTEAVMRASKLGWVGRSYTPVCLPPARKKRTSQS